MKLSKLLIVASLLIAASALSGSIATADVVVHDGEIIVPDQNGD